MNSDARPQKPGSAIVGRFDDREAAERAVERLRAHGFAMEHVGFLGRHQPPEHEEEHEGALRGAASGSLAGGVIGGLIGAVATALIPGVGPIVSAGILSGIVAGAPAGAVVGGVAGALHSAGVHKDAAHHYAREFHNGRTLVTVHAEGREGEAIRILRHAGGEVDTPGGPAPAPAPDPDLGPRHEHTRDVEERNENTDGYDPTESAADPGPSEYTGGPGEPRPGTLGTPGRERF